MNQRQLRLGDVLDDYCPRERRLTNHAVVAMVGHEVKQTRCTTCDAEHQYKHAKVPRPRKKSDVAPALVGGSAVALPKKPSPAAPFESPVSGSDGLEARGTAPAAFLDAPDDAAQSAWLAGSASEGRGGVAADGTDPPAAHEDEAHDDEAEEGTSAPHDGPAHRRLIRATLPRIEGQPPQIQRQAPDFTIRQPAGGRPGRFRPRPGRGPDQSQGRSQGFDRHAGGHSGPPRHGERQNVGHRPTKQHGFNRKRSK